MNYVSVASMAVGKLGTLLGESTERFGIEDYYTEKNGLE